MKNREAFEVGAGIAALMEPGCLEGAWQALQLLAVVLFCAGAPLWFLAGGRIGPNGSLVINSSPGQVSEARPASSDAGSPQAATTQQAAGSSPPTLTPTASNAERTTALLAQIDEPWARGDWPQVIDVLTRARTYDPSNQTITDKLYVAYYNDGQRWLSQGNRVAAIEQFQNAFRVSPDRIEARQALAELVPTPTRTTPLLRPTNTPTPSPARPQGCTLGADDPFSQIWQGSNQAQLGCAISSRSDAEYSQIPMQGGQMIWRADNRQVYVLYGDNQTWEAYTDTYQEGQPEFAEQCKSLTRGRQPQKGFGRVWCLNPQVRNRIGWVVQDETGLIGKYYQNFDHGLMLWLEHNLGFYVLFGNGHWSKP